MKIVSKLEVEGNIFILKELFYRVRRGGLYF